MAARAIPDTVQNAAFQIFVMAGSVKFQKLAGPRRPFSLKSKTWEQRPGWAPSCIGRGARSTPVDDAQYNDQQEFDMQDMQTASCSDAMLTRPAEVVSIDIESLYRTHHQHVLLFVRRYVRDVSDAEDVVQSAFLEATRCAAKFSNLSKPSTWLFGIALNMARNHVRRKMPDAMFCDVDEEGHEVQDPYGDPASLVEARDLVNKSMALIDSLSDELKSTFHAVLESDQTYGLAARELGIPIGTVRSRLSRIRGQLRGLTERRQELEAPRMVM